MKKRLTRQESRAQTREKLLEAAAKIIARHGLAGTSIEDIAETAGFSRGAFHANFKSKDELFLTLVEKQMKATIFEIDELHAVTDSVEEKLQNLRTVYPRYTGSDRDTFLLITEAQMYALRNPRFGKKLRALFSTIYDDLIQSVERLQEQMGCKDPVYAKQLVLIGFGLSHGLILHNLMDPERYPDSMVSDSMRLVFDKIFSLEEMSLGIH
jgi:AcrR family transcriptional regulator